MLNGKLGIAHRVRQIREELYGENGIEVMAKIFDVPVRTWLNFEQGVMMRADILLEFLVVTGVAPNWLLTGEGERLTGEGHPRGPEWMRLTDVFEHP
jgi:hypothetical protein